MLGIIGQVFCRLSLKKDLSSVSPGTREKSGFWKGSPQRCNTSFKSLITSYHIDGADCQQDSVLLLALVTWLGQCSPRVLHGKVLSPPASYCPLWGEVTMQCPYLRNGDLCSTFLFSKCQYSPRPPTWVRVTVWWCSTGGQGQVPSLYFLEGIVFTQSMQNPLAQEDCLFSPFSYFV